MGKPEKEITNRAKALSMFVSDMPLIENPVEWHRLFDIYQEYIDAGGDDPRMIRLLERLIERNFKPIQDRTKRTKELINLCEQYLGVERKKRAPSKGETPAIKRKPNESNEDFNERKDMLNWSKNQTELSNKLKKGAHTSSKTALNRKIKSLALDMGFPKIEKIDKASVQELLELALARPKVSVKEGDWIYEIIQNNISRVANGKDHPMKVLIASKTFELLMNGDKPYDPDRSKGEKIKFITQACRLAFQFFWGKPKQPGAKKVHGHEDKAKKVIDELKRFEEIWKKAPDLMERATTGRGHNPRSVSKK